MVTWLHRLERRRRGFTLIEMLVVIGVIAILAGIIIGALPAARNKSIRSRVIAEMKGLELAINNYKAKHNFFPPDNVNDFSKSSLFYELTGTTNNPAINPVPYWSKFAPNDPPLAQNDLQNLFNVGGILNTAQADDEASAPNFFRTLKPSQIREMPPANGAPAYKVFVAPRFGLDKQPAVWHYNKSRPTNNVGEFDLWAVIDVGGEPVVINNWEN